MQLTRTHRTTRCAPWAAAGALLLTLSSCGTQESNAAPAAVTPPAKIAKHGDTNASQPAKLENPPAAEPKPAADPIPAPPMVESKPTPPPPAPPPVIEPKPTPPPVIDPPAPKPEPKPEPAPEPTPKPADVSVTGFETGGSVGTDGHVGDPKTVFAPADTVNLAVLADGAARSVHISVTWLGPDGARVHEEAQDQTLGAPKAVPFALTDPKGLAVGRYKAEIRIENWLASTAEFEVR
jgi:hypothetical protein